MNVECPSGREVDLRKMKLSDEDIITNVRLAKEGTNIDVLLERVTGLSQDELDEMLIGDRVFLLIELRRISRGDLFYPRVTCPVCENRYEEEIDLSKLEIRKLDQELFDEEFKFELTLPVCGEKLIARLLKGAEEKHLRKIRKNHPDKLMSYLMMLRTESIEGKTVKNVEWFRELDTEDSDYFREEYDKRDCGVETTVEASCRNSSCRAVYDLEIPFDATFFLQTRKRKKTS